MATKRIATLNIGTNGEKSLKAGQFTPPKGKILKAMICKLTIPTKNATGGDVVGLTDAQKQSFLDCLRFNVAFGKGLTEKPFIAQLGNRIHREARHAFNSEIEGYADAVTGWGKTFTSATTSNAIIWLPIPLGRMESIPARERHLFGMGRSQCRTLEISIKREKDTSSTANLTIDSAVELQVEMYPDYESCKGDVNGLVPRYVEKDEVGDDVTIENDGLILRVGERTATHAATALTNFDVHIDEEEIYSGIDPTVITRELNDDPLLTTAGNLADREVILYAPRSGTSLRFLPTGKPKVRQNKKDIATPKFNVLFVPYKDEKEVKTAVQYVADELRGKTVRASNAFLATGLDLPKRTAGLPFWVNYDQDDRELEQAPGWQATPKATEPVLLIPDSLLSAAKGRYVRHEAAGEKKAASNVEKELAVLVPGAVDNGRGTRSGFSGVLNRVSQMFR